jgi:hypothetical protein
MGRYNKAVQSKAVAQLLPPQAQSLELVSQSMGVQIKTLKRWLSAEQKQAARGPITSGVQRLDAVVATASLNELNKGTWCREHGVYLADLERWQAQAAAALTGQPQKILASPKHTQQDKQRIKDLERELLRKERALAETAALLVLSKKLEAILCNSEAA